MGGREEGVREGGREGGGMEGRREEGGRKGGEGCGEGNWREGRKNSEMKKALYLRERQERYGSEEVQYKRQYIYEKEGMTNSCCCPVSFP